MGYIASMPVRFDRQYKIGEIIPPEIINPNMARKLIEMGKIIEVSLPETKKQETETTGRINENGPENEPDASEGAESNGAPETDKEQAGGQENAQDADSAGNEEPTEMRTGHLDAEQLATWKNADLEKLAADLGVDISKAKNKMERAQLIAAAEVHYPAAAEDGEAREAIALPDE